MWRSIAHVGSLDQWTTDQWSTDLYHRPVPQTWYTSFCWITDPGIGPRAKIVCCNDNPTVGCRFGNISETCLEGGRTRNPIGCLKCELVRNRFLTHSPTCDIDHESARREFGCSPEAASGRTF